MSGIDAQQVAAAIRDALVDLVELVAPEAGWRVLGVEPPPDLGPERVLRVVLERQGHRLRASLPAGLAAAYLADEENAVDAFERWLEALVGES